MRRGGQTRSLRMPLRWWRGCQRVRWRVDRLAWRRLLLLLLPLLPLLLRLLVPLLLRVLRRSLR